MRLEDGDTLHPYIVFRREDGDKPHPYIGGTSLVAKAAPAGLIFLAKNAKDAKKWTQPLRGSTSE